ERRVVVRFDLEHRCEAVADVDGAGVLARPLQHAWSLGRQRAEVHARALVAAVLRPHDREDAELREIRFPPEKLDDSLVLLCGDAVALEDFGVDAHASARAFTMDFSTTRPSVLPSASSHARSGCG